MIFKIITLLVVLLLYVTSHCNGLRQLPVEQVKMVMLLEGQFNSDEPNTEYQCYISNSDVSTSVESFRKINTRQPTNTGTVGGQAFMSPVKFLNPEPPNAVPVGGSNAQWRVDLNEENNNDFGVFGCRATQAGRRETEILGVFMRSDADIIPKDEVFTKTVGPREVDVSIDVEVIRPPPNRTDGIIIKVIWLKDNFRNDDLKGMKSWRITNPVRVDDAGVYECHYDRRRDSAFQGLQLLIVRACASGRWGPPDCFGICDNCYNGGICDDKTGQCICAPGFMGPNCMTGCGSDKFGYQCEFSCATGNTENGCQGKQFCLVDPFGCRCNTGFRGLNCSDECKDGEFGAGCLQECHCQNQDSCNRFTGLCDSVGCETPWSGQNCQIPGVCPDGYYGSDCTLKCLCMDNDACARSTGQCNNSQCAPGSKQNGGLNCEACDEGFFGDSCSGECHCTPDACDIVTGECDGCCLPQWVDSSSCQDGISGFDVVKVNPGAESMITCQGIVRSTNMQTYQFQLSRSQERLDEDGVSAMSPSPLSCRSNLCSRSRSFTISNTQPNDQFYCLLLDGSNQIVAWLNTSSITFVLPVLMEPPEIIFRNQSSVTIRWKPWDQQSDIGDPPIVGYVTYYREASETSVWMPADKVMDNEMLQFTYSGLFQDTNYEFSVAAVREGINGNGSMSPSVTSRTLCNRPTAVPSSVLVENLDMARLNISWKVEGSIANCSTGITSFIIYFKRETSNDETQMLVTSSDTWIIVSEEDGLQPGQRYTFYVSLVTDQESDLSQPSEPVTLQHEEATSRPPNGPPGSPLAVIVAVIAVVIVISVVIIVVVAIKRRRKPQPVQPIGRPEAVYANNIMSTEDEQPTAGSTVVTPVPPPNEYMVSDFEQSPNRSSDLTPVKSETVNPTPPEVPVPQVYQELNEDEDQDDDEPDENDVGPDAGEIYMNVPRPIPVADLPTYYRGNADKLSGEFQQLKRGQQCPWTFGEKNENKKKNRFRLMFTYDHSRVVLDTLPDDKHSDYYNASHIKDHKGKESFIASQAPNRASLNDFWRMIWKEEVYTIVMLTNLYELGKDRCTQYWPDREGRSKSFGNVVVSWAGTQHFADFDIRELQVTQMSEMRTIYQLHYSTWPDKNIPSDQAPLMELIKMTKLTHEGKVTPILTHCSAGVGRTGTFITIYCLMEVIKTEKDIHIFGFVEQARRDRINMVQTEVQYGFIYKCLVDFCLTRHTEIPFKQLSNYSTNSKRDSLAKQFQLLNQVNVKRDSSTRRTVDRSRDRYQDSGPNEMGRVFLISEGSDGFSNYINATLYRSIRKTNAFIATQSPLPNTVEDFWRLVYDWKCSVIVMLNQLDPNDKTCVEYWPRSGHAQFGSIGVSCIDSSNYSTHILRKFEVFHSRGKSAFTVCQLQLLQWPDSSNLGLWKELIQAVRIAQIQQQNMEPTLVHCINGVQLSGIFVAVEIALEYFNATGSLDVFKTIREMRQRNSHVMQHQEDYQLCFNILQFLLHSGNESYENVTFNERSAVM